MYLLRSTLGNLYRPRVKGYMKGREWNFGMEEVLEQEDLIKGKISTFS
jgi:hypothetical protein